MAANIPPLGQNGAPGSRNPRKSAGMSEADEGDEGDFEICEEALSNIATAFVFRERCADEMENMTKTRLYTDDLCEQRLDLAKVKRALTTWNNIKDGDIDTDFFDLYKIFVSQSGNDLSNITGNKYVRLLFLYRGANKDQGTDTAKTMIDWANCFAEMNTKLDELRDDMSGNILAQVTREKANIINLAPKNTNELYEHYNGLLTDKESANVWGKYVALTGVFDGLHAKLKLEDIARDSTFPTVTNSMQSELRHCQELVGTLTAKDKEPEVFILAFVDLVCYLCKSSLPEFKITPLERTPWFEHLIDNKIATSAEPYCTLIVLPYRNIWLEVKEKQTVFERQLDEVWKNYLQDMAAYCAESPDNC